MSRKPFDRVVYRDLEGPVALDYNLQQAEGADAGLRHLLRGVGCPVTSPSVVSPLSTTFGFYADGFLVLPESPASTNVVILPGVGMRRDDADAPSNIADVPGLDEVSDLKPLILRAPKVVAVPPPPAAPNSRIDIIEVAVRRDLYDSTPTAFLQVPSGQRATTNVLKTLSYALDDLAVGYVNAPANNTQPIGYKVGIAAAVPAVPATSPGYQKIAEILVDNVVTNPAGTIRQEHLGDFRRMLFVGGVGTFSMEVEFALGGGAPSILSWVAPPGIRLAAARTAAAGTSQFAVFVLNNVGGANFQASSYLNYAPTNFDTPRIQRNTATAVTGTEKTLIDDATLTSPTQKVPLRQPTRYGVGEIYRWDETTQVFIDSDRATLGFVVSGTIY